MGLLIFLNQDMIEKRRKLAVKLPVKLGSEAQFSYVL